MRWRFLRIPPLIPLPVALSISRPVITFGENSALESIFDDVISESAVFQVSPDLPGKPATSAFPLHPVPLLPSAPGRKRARTSSRCHTDNPRHGRHVLQE